MDLDFDHIGVIRLQGDTLLIEGENNAIYILRRNGSTWELEQEISKDNPVNGVSLDFERISYLKFMMTLYSLKNTIEKLAKIHFIS